MTTIRVRLGGARRGAGSSGTLRGSPDWHRIER